MNQLSLLDLPEDPSSHEEGGPTLWWAFKYRPLHQQAVADFRRDYGVAPIFHFEWPRRQVFLATPAEPLIIDRASGLLAETRMHKLWLQDYRQAKAFRPQDVAPQIRDILSGARSRETWRPMTMVEFKVPSTRVERLTAQLAEQDIFARYWPGRRDHHVFRLFGQPDMLESLMYSEDFGVVGSGRDVL